MVKVLILISLFIFFVFALPLFNQIMVQLVLFIKIINSARVGPLVPIDIPFQVVPESQQILHLVPRFVHSVHFGLTDAGFSPDLVSYILRTRIRVCCVRMHLSYIKLFKFKIS